MPLYPKTVTKTLKGKNKIINTRWFKYDGDDLCVNKSHFARSYLNHLVFTSCFHLTENRLSPLQKNSPIMPRFLLWKSHVIPKDSKGEMKKL